VGSIQRLRGGGEFHRRGARLMTTNYDDLLEYYCGLQRVRRSLQEDVRRYKQGILNGVFHIHGSFQNSKKMILNSVGYYQIKTSDDVQNLFKIYLEHNIILFVGYSSEFEDSNFNDLLEWANSREKNIPNYHYLLVRNGNNLRYNPFITLKYGRNYKDIVPYLNKLLNDPADPSTKKKISVESDSDI
jgi:hypothetical protein